MTRRLGLKSALVQYSYEYEYEAGSAYRIQPYLRSNARAVDTSLALKTRYSDSDGLRGKCCCLVRSAHRPHLVPSPLNILKIVKSRDRRPFTLRYALQNIPPRARHVVYVRNGAGNSRSRCAFTSRNFRPTDTGSTAIQCHFGFKIIIIITFHAFNPSCRAER